MVPFWLMLLLVALPLFFMEVTIGQYAGLSGTKIYGRIAPIFRGLGFGQVAIPTVGSTYYTVILAYSVYYVFRGFTANKELPWGLCSHDYNSANCYSLVEADNCNFNQTFFNHTCVDINNFCQDHGFDYDFDIQENQFHRTCFNASGYPIRFEDVEFRVSASEEFWFKEVLKLSVNLTENGAIINTEESSWTKWGNCNWEIAGCLALCWTIVCLSLIKGVEIYGMSEK